MSVDITALRLEIATQLLVGAELQSIHEMARSLLISQPGGWASRPANFTAGTEARPPDRILSEVRYGS
jgi:hypothetical protein